MSECWNSLTKSAHVVCIVFTSAIPVVTDDWRSASRTSFVMSEISVRSAVGSVNDVLKTFMRDALSPWRSSLDSPDHTPGVGGAQTTVNHNDSPPDKSTMTE